VDSVQLVSAAPALFRETFAGSSGDERTPSLGWSAKAYVFHVADNLQIWSNRVATARSTSHVLAVAEYDSDLLAQARNYEGSTLDEALTSLDHAAEHWTRVMAGERGEVSIDHPARGLLSLEDIGRDQLSRHTSPPPRHLTDFGLLTSPLTVRPS
jgi:hypothetical protein